MQVIEVTSQSSPIQKDTFDSICNLLSFTSKKTYAIIISVQNYGQHEKCLPARGKYVDELIRGLRKKSLAYNEECVIELCEGNASKKNIFQAFISCESKIRKEDNLLVLLSGLSTIQENKRYFIPFGADKKQDYISHEDLFSAIQFITATNILVTYDWQDLNESQRLHYILETDACSKFETQKSEEVGQSASLKDVFEIAFKNFISFKPTTYDRQVFLFLRSVEHLVSRISPFPMQRLMIEDSKANTLKRWIEENRFREVIQAMEMSIDQNDELFSQLLATKWRVLNLKTLEKADSPNNTAIEKEVLEIKDNLQELLDLFKRNGMIVGLLSHNQHLQSFNKKKILISSANPTDMTALRLDKEIRRIEEEICKSGFQDRFVIIKLTATRIMDLQDALLRHSPNYVHFSGHGCQDGICLLSDQDLKDVVTNRPLAKLFSLFADDIECVFLNSCYSKHQSEIIRESIPKVIGMKESVEDNTAIEFAAAFYKAISFNRTVDFSFQFAINAIDLNKLEGSDVPILLS